MLNFQVLSIISVHGSFLIFPTKSCLFPLVQAVTPPLPVCALQIFLWNRQIPALYSSLAPPHPALVTHRAFSSSLSQSLHLNGLKISGLFKARHKNNLRTLKTKPRNFSIMAKYILYINRRLMCIL